MCAYTLKILKVQIVSFVYIFVVHEPSRVSAGQSEEILIDELSGTRREGSFLLLLKRAKSASGEKRLIP